LVTRGSDMPENEKLGNSFDMRNMFVS